MTYVRSQTKRVSWVPWPYLEVLDHLLDHEKGRPESLVCCKHVEEAVGEEDGGDGEEDTAHVVAVLVKTRSCTFWRGSWSRDKKGSWSRDNVNFESVLGGLYKVSTTSGSRIAAYPQQEC